MTSVYRSNQQLLVILVAALLLCCFNFWCSFGPFALLLALMAAVAAAAELLELTTHQLHSVIQQTAPRLHKTSAGPWGCFVRTSFWSLAGPCGKHGIFCRLLACAPAGGSHHTTHMDCYTTQSCLCVAAACSVAHGMARHGAAVCLSDRFVGHLVPW